MKKIALSEKQIKSIINNLINEQNDDGTYMTIQNLIQIKENVEKILSFKDNENFKNVFTGEHAWAADHISTSKDDVEEVANFLEGYMSQKNKSVIYEDEYGSVENVDLLNEAEYKGKKITLNKPFYTPDGPKKRSVYVKNDKGNVVKVNFGDPNMKIKKSDPERRKSFRARHNCENPGPKWKPRYWSCKFW